MIRDLGITKYQDTFSAMKDFVAKGDKEAIWLVEHEPVFTLGTAADQKHILKTVRNIPDCSTSTLHPQECDRL